MKSAAFSILLVCVSIGFAKPASGGDALPKLFDPNRHMRVDEVRAGMKGHGLSVFKGATIEKFDVEVVSVLHNFNPKRDVVLIRCAGQNLEHTGAIAGMSGSPIFLRDANGRDRMIGAFAYGWSLAKDPVAGVQPIQYMLELADQKASDDAIAPRTDARPPRQAWNLLSSMKIDGGRISLRRHAGVQSTPRNPYALRPLAMPLATGGVPASVLRRYADHFSAHGLVLLDGAATGKGQSDSDMTIEPGSVVVTPLVTGDAEFHANGTCTEVIGEQVFAFGHPFSNEGAVSLPLAAGTVDAVIASLDSSFKIAAIGPTRGAVNFDRSVGIAGKLGPGPAMVPIDVTIIRPGGAETIYHFNAARHPRLLPILTAAAIDSALLSESALPQYHTIRYDLSMTFDNGRMLRIDNVDVNAASDALLMQFMLPLMAAAENPFERVLPRKIGGRIEVTAEARDAQILAVQLPKTKFRPGDKITGFITYRPFRGDEGELPFSLELPRDLADGPYQLVIGDWTRYFTDEAAARPFRFTAETIGEVFDVMADVNSIRHDELFIRLLRQPDGVAVGRVAMSQLPSSRRQVLLGAGRSNVTPFVSSTVKRMKTEFLMTGSAEFTIQIESKTKVESGRAATTRPAG